jgi:hypothetical protein
MDPTDILSGLLTITAEAEVTKGPGNPDTDTEEKEDVDGTR